MGFTKLFSSIITSTIWMEDHPTRIVWVGLLALANANGVVDGSIPGLANVCRVSIEECRKAIDIFLAADQDSRNPENDGRRIEMHPGGWKILNYQNYRDRGQDKDGSRADYMRRYRSLLQPVTRNNQTLHVIQKQKQKTEAEKTLFVEDSPEIKLALYHLKNIRKNNPEFKTPNLQQWAEQIDLMHRIDNRNYDDIAKVSEWCQKDSFWKSNILSTKKLREKYDQLWIKMGRH